MAVYFVQAGEGGPIKIGFASNVGSRLGKMRADSPLPIVVIAVLEGGRADEAALHERFADCRVHGEWFAAEDSLLSFIRGLPKWDPPKRRRGRSGEPTAHPLRQYRDQRGLSLDQLAKLVGITHSTISRIERARCRAGHKLLIRLSEITEIPIRDLLLASEPRAA